MGCSTEGSPSPFRLMIDDLNITYAYQAKLASYYFAAANPTYSPDRSSVASLLIEFHVI